MCEDFELSATCHSYTYEAYLSNVKEDPNKNCAEIVGVEYSYRCDRCSDQWVYNKRGLYCFDPDFGLPWLNGTLVYNEEGSVVAKAPDMSRPEHLAYRLPVMDINTIQCEVSPFANAISRLRNASEPRPRKSSILHQVSNT